MQDIKQQLLEEFSEYETNFEKGILYTIGKHKHTILDYVGKLLNLAVEQEKEKMLAMVLKEIEEALDVEIDEESTENLTEQAKFDLKLTLLKEKLQAKQ